MSNPPKKYEVEPNSTDELFNIIRKELNTIIEYGEKTSKNTQTTAKILSIEAEKTTNETANKNASPKKHLSPLEKARSGRMRAGIDPVVAAPSKVDVNLLEMGNRFKSTLEEDISKQTALLDSPRAKSIDADLQKMQMDLQESYNLFQGISEKFESIDFTRLQKRIKDLNLSKKCELYGNATKTADLKEAVEQGFKNNSFSELTNQMGDKFRRHPGEFGNIPELSSFFQACTQLEHVLSKLKRQRGDVEDLEERMRRASEISYNRINHIKTQLLEPHFQNSGPGSDDTSGTDRIL